jgi:hypothetical protein
MKTENMKAERYQCGRGICDLHLQDLNETGRESGRLYKLESKEISQNGIDHSEPGMVEREMRGRCQ